MFPWSKKKERGDTLSPRHDCDEEGSERLSERPASDMAQPDSTASLNDPGCSTGDSSLKLVEAGLNRHRPSLVSVVSDTSSVCSYHTATNFFIHGTNKTSSSSSVAEKATATDAPQPIREEVLQLVTNISHRVTELERRVETSHQKFEARFESIELKLQQLKTDSVPRSVGSEEDKTSPTLPVLPEDDESAAGTQMPSRTQPLPCPVGVAIEGPPRNRTYTDSEPEKVKGHRNIMKWKLSFARKKSLSLQELLSHKSCDQQVIVWLTEKVQRWKFLARRLGLQESDVSRIESDHPQDTREQCYQMFLRLRAVDPENYTYPVLGEALRKESQELYNDYVKEVHRVEYKITLPVPE